MQSPADRDFFGRFLWPAIIGLLACTVLQVLLTLYKPCDGVLKTIVDVVLAVNPNIIAGLLSPLVLYGVVRDSDRKHYVKAMRTLRSSVNRLLESNNINADQVQSLMVDFVPAISQLYYRQNEPTVPAGEQNRNYEKKICVACAKPFPVKCGRCEKCHDIQASWTSKEIAPVE